MSAADTLRAEAAKRILVKDGAYGTSIQSRRLKSEDYRGGLDLTEGPARQQRSVQPHPARAGRGDRPRVRRSRRGHPRHQHLQRQRDQPGRLRRRGPCRDINRAAARIVREVADRYSASRRQAALGRGRARARPTRPCRCRPTSTIPAYREVDFDTMKAVYREQVDALVEGGVDFILIETISTR